MKENMKLESVGLDRIHIEDKFWTKYIKLVKQVMIPYQWEAMNDRIPDTEPSHCLKNFEIAAGLYEGEFYGAVFQDTDIAKWLEAVGFTLSAVKDEELERRKVAIIRGPIVYCLEDTDNGSNLAAVYASADHPLLEKKSDAFGGIVEIEFTGWRIEENNWNTTELYGDYPVELKPVPLKAVPYACWNNRGIGEMTVWMKEKI